MKEGDEVVCIDDSIKGYPPEEHSRIFPSWIKEGEIYTIRSRKQMANGKYGVLLEEVKNPPVYVEALFGKIEPTIHEIRFQKLEALPEDLFIEEVEELKEH